MTDKSMRNITVASGPSKAEKARVAGHCFNVQLKIDKHFYGLEEAKIFRDRIEEVIATIPSIDDEGFKYPE